MEAFAIQRALKIHLILLFGIFSLTLSAQNADSLSSIDFTEMRNKIFRSLQEQGIYDLRDKKLPSFKLVRVDGKEFDFEGLVGQPTIVNFWFTACAPCLEEIPMLNRIQKSYSQTVNFIAITYQDSTEISSFLEKKPFHFTQLVDAQDYWDQLGIKTAPHTLVTDRNGIVRYIDKERPRDLNEFETELRNQIEQVLEQ